MQLQTLVSRRNKATDPVVLTFGKIFGGTAPNIIPDQVTMQGTMRTFDKQVQQFHLKTLRELSTGFCRASGGDCEVRVESSLPPLINSPEICRQIRASAKTALGEDCLSASAGLSMGSDDFSCILEACGGSGARFLVGTGVSGLPETQRGLHAADNVFLSQALDTAVASLVQFSLDYLA